MKMQKMSLLAGFFSLLFCLCVTATAQAVAPGCNDQGPGKGVLGAIENHADAQRVGSKANAHEIVKQPDNAPGMTCFDRQMVLSSRLGRIFSDVMPQNVKPENTQLFGQSVFPNMGTDQLLVSAIDGTVSGLLIGHASDFINSISALLGATALGYLQNIASQVIGRVMALVSGPLSTLQGFVTALNSAYQKLQQAIALLRLAMPSLIPALITGINTAWQLVNQAIQTVVNHINSAVRTAFTAITGFINGLASLLLSNSPSGECSRMAQFWGNGQPGGFLDAIEGMGIEVGTRYFTFFDLVKPGGPGGMGPDFDTEILNAINIPLLTRAYQDLNAGGKLSGPGILNSWPTSPIFPPNTPLATIISGM